MLKDNFFGRESYLDILEKRVTALKDGFRQNIALIGGEQVGKTSILHKFLKDFADNHFILFYIEARPESPLLFCRRFIGALLYNFLSLSGIPLKENLEFLIDKSSSFIPKTTAKIRAILADVEKRNRENIFSELLSLTNIIHQETDKFCVVIFDEFQNLEYLKIKNLYKDWSQRLMLEKGTMFIIASSSPHKAKNILAQDLSLLFGNFEVLTIEPFDSQTSAEYLKEKLNPANISEEIINFIVHFTGGYPFYLEIFSQFFAKSGNAGLIDTIENLLFNSTGILNQKFTNYIKRFQETQFSQDYLSILHLISNGQNKIKDIAHILKKPANLISVRVNFLLTVDAVLRSGDFWKISDRLFSFWLKFVYQEKLNSFTFDAQNQKDLFRKTIEKLIQEFFSSAKKPVSERVAEILRLFADEKILIERKKITLNQFWEIKPLNFDSQTLKEGLICRSSGSLWIFGFKHDLVSEEDISEFSRECRKYRNKPHRKIIVTVKGIDANSRLKALEEKIWTWDLNSLNNILDLFSKPRIIA